MKKVLSIDGGGVRGLIPAMVLSEVERVTGKNISDLFDCITGTSTGGLIALALAKSSKKSSKLTAEDLVDVYLQKSKVIFELSISRRLYTGFGLWGSKYSRSNYDSIAQEIFQEEFLSETTCSVFIPSYSVDHATPIILNSQLAKETKFHDFYLRDVAAATSAAPTYFPTKTFNNLENNKKFITADGGIFANNPELVGLIGIFVLFPKLKRRDIFMLSLGTGSIEGHNVKKGNSGVVGWLGVKDLIGGMIDAESLLTDMFVDGFLDSSNYSRLQPTLDAKNMAMDNATASNLNELQACAREFINLNEKLINEICKKLT